MFFWYIFIFLSLSPTNNADEGENVALKKPVIVNGRWGYCLTDGNFRTTVSPNEDEMPLVAVDLKDVYELSSIRVHAQNEGTFGDAGLNRTFSVYIWPNDSTVCDIAGEYPWKIVKSDLIFTKRGEEVIIQGPIVARYIIVLVHRDDETTKTSGLTMGELRAFGRKVKDGYRPETFDKDEPMDNKHFEIRKKLLPGQKYLYVEPSYFEYKLNPNYLDVALSWNDNKINTMYVERGEGRVIVMSGVEGTKRLLHNDDYDFIRGNFLAWLSRYKRRAKFVKLNETYKSRDILLITRDDQFNVDQIAQEILTKKRGAIISYSGSKDSKDDDASKLLKKLEILYTPHEKKYNGMNVALQGNILSLSQIPITYRLKRLQSFKEFKTDDFGGYYNEEEVRNPTVQELTRQILKRYYNSSKYYTMCPRYPYKFDLDTATALLNYNRMLLLQRGNKIQPAFGVSHSPGTISPMAKPTNYTVTFNIDISGSFFPMGGYAKPGEAFRYKVISASDPKLSGYGIRINPQTDNVYLVESIARWPIVTSYYDLKMEDQLNSPFGGPIVLKIPSNANLTIQFENVYRYPWFDIRNPNSEKNWESEKEKYKGVPFLMVFGDSMISMMDTSIITQMTGVEIKWATNYYDNVVKMIHNYRGSSHEKAQLEVFVTDDQLVAGFGHSGYPWMGYRSWAHSFRDLNEIKAGKVIGYPHEIGHNLQMWSVTFVNGTEVTNNMYIPVLHHYLLGLASFEKGGVPGYRDSDVEQLIGNWKTEEYQGVRESYYTFFGRYFSPALVGNVLHIASVTKEPLNSEERKVGFFIKNLCNESGYDLVPFHRMWHFPINDETVQFCGKFPCWFPDDEITQKVPELVTKAKEGSKTQCSSAPPKKVAYKFDIMHGINKTKPQSIFIHM